MSGHGRMDMAVLSLMAQPWFAISQVCFTAGVGAHLAAGIQSGDLSGLGAVAVATVIPSTALLFAFRIQRRLRAVESERPFDASEVLLVGLLFAMEVLAVLALMLAVPLW